VKGRQTNPSSADQKAIVREATAAAEGVQTFFGGNGVRSRRERRAISVAVEVGIGATATE
jgi:hypothetical protein